MSTTTGTIKGIRINGVEYRTVSAEMTIGGVAYPTSGMDIRSRVFGTSITVPLSKDEARNLQRLLRMRARPRRRSRCQTRVRAFGRALRKKIEAASIADAIARMKEAFPQLADNPAFNPKMCRDPDCGMCDVGPPRKGDI